MSEFTLEERVRQLEFKIVSLQKDIDNHSKIYMKLDETIEKLRELSQSMTNMLSLHEHKFAEQASSSEKLQEAVFEDQKEMKRELKDFREQMSKDMGKINNEINSIYKWKWLVMGGGVVVIWLLERAVELLPGFMGH